MELAASGVRNPNEALAFDAIIVSPQRALCRAKDALLSRKRMFETAVAMGVMKALVYRKFPQDASELFKTVTIRSYYAVLGAAHLDGGIEATDIILRPHYSIKEIDEAFAHSVTDQAR